MARLIACTPGGAQQGLHEGLRPLPIAQAGVPVVAITANAMAGDGAASPPA